MRHIRAVVMLLRPQPAILAFLGSTDIGRAYGVGFRAKLRLLLGFHRNTRRVETLSDFREHVELASAILRVPPEIDGAVVECGCYLGGSTVNLSLVCALTGRKLIVFDSFAGLPEPRGYDKWHHAVHSGHTDVYYKGRFAASQETVRQNVTRWGKIDVCEFRAGYYEESMTEISDSVVVAFLDVDLIDSLKACLKGLWPNLKPECRVYTHEAGNLPLISVFFDQEWWQENLHEVAPGFVGSGVGLPLGVGWGRGSELGYAQKASLMGEDAPDQDPEVLSRALTPAEREVYEKLNSQSQG